MQIGTRTRAAAGNGSRSLWNVEDLTPVLRRAVRRRRQRASGRGGWRARLRPGRGDRGCDDVVRNGHLAGGDARPHDGLMWWRRSDQVLDAETLSGLIRILMRIEAKLEDVLELLKEDDDEEEEADE